MRIEREKGTKIFMTGGSGFGSLVDQNYLGVSNVHMSAVDTFGRVNATSISAFMHLSSITDATWPVQYIAPDWTNRIIFTWWMVQRESLSR